MKNSKKQRFSDKILLYCSDKCNETIYATAEFYNQNLIIRATHIRLNRKTKRDGQNG